MPSQNDRHRVYMSFQDRQGWHCQFLEQDLKTPLPKKLHFAASMLLPIKQWLPAASIPLTILLILIFLLLIAATGKSEFRLVRRAFWEKAAIRAMSPARPATRVSIFASYIVAGRRRDKCDLDARGIWGV